MEEDKSIIWDYLTYISNLLNSEEVGVKIVTTKENIFSVLVELDYSRKLFFNIKNKNNLISIYDIEVIGHYHKYTSDYNLVKDIIEVMKPIIRDNKLKRLNI